MGLLLESPKVTVSFIIRERQASGRMKVIERGTHDAYSVGAAFLELSTASGAFPGSPVHVTVEPIA